MDVELSEVNRRTDITGEQFVLEMGAKRVNCRRSDFGFRKQRQALNAAEMLYINPNIYEVRYCEECTYFHLWVTRG